jgi:hypothetical protein
MCIVLMMSTLFMTTLSITKERERGTMENLLAMPVRPIEVMVAKMVPYVFIGYIQVVLILVASAVFFQLPLRGSLVTLLMALGLFIAGNLALGITFSTVSANQMQAMQFAQLTLMPSFLLSGFMFPFRGMPVWAQYVGELFPTTHAMRIVRGVLQGTARPTSSPSCADRGVHGGGGGDRGVVLSRDAGVSRYIPLRPPFPGHRAKFRKSPRRDRRADACHQVLVIVQVHFTEQHGAQHFVGLDQVMQISPPIVPRGRAAAFGIERARIGGVAGVAQVDRAEPRIDEAVAAVAGRQHAVEHIHAAPDRFEKVVRRADAHEITRPVGRRAAPPSRIMSSITFCGSPTASPPIA